MERDDRMAVFEKAGTRDLPIVFIDDAYVGDYDILAAKEESGELDRLLESNKHAFKLVGDISNVAYTPAVTPAASSPAKMASSNKSQFGVKEGVEIVRGAATNEKHVVNLKGNDCTSPSKSPAVGAEKK
jgi:hypothetical protein